MKALRRSVLLAAVVALVAVPASASAAPNVKQVRGAVQQSKSALKDATAAARAGQARQLRAAMAEVGTHVRKADRKARKLKRKAEGRRDRVRAAKALAAVAGQYDRVVGRFAHILDEVPVDVQYLIAEGITIGAEYQERVIAILLRLAEKLPDPAAQAVLDAIERFEADGDLKALVTALASDEVTPAVKSVLSERVDEMFAHLESLVDRLGAIDPELAGMVSGVLDSVRGVIEQVSGMLSGLFDGLLGGGIPLFPGFDSLPGFGELFSDLPGFGGQGGHDGSSSWGSIFGS